MAKILKTNSNRVPVSVTVAVKRTGRHTLEIISRLPDGQEMGGWVFDLREGETFVLHGFEMRASCDFS